MKKYRFILGLTLAVFSSAWLIYLVRLPLAAPFGQPSRSALKGEVALAVISFCFGVGLILFDAFLRNPRLEELEKEEKALRSEILASLSETPESQQELNAYINQVFGKTGIFGLRLDELERLKSHVERKVEKAATKEI